MKRMKQIISIILVAVLALSFVGCSKDGNTEGDVVTLKWFVPGDAQPDHAAVMAKVNELVEKKIGVKVDLQFIDLGSFSERMKMNMASQTEFDIMWVGYANSYYDVIDKGGIIDMTELLDKTPELKKSIPDYFWEASKYDGKIYAVPNVQIAATQYGYDIKKDLVEKYNIDVTKIKKADDMESVLKTIKENEKGLYTFQPKYGAMMWAFDDYQVIDATFLAVRKDDPTGKVVNLLDTPEYQKGINTLRSWYEKGYIRPDVSSVTDDNINISQGKYGVQINVQKPGQEADFFARNGYEIVSAPTTTAFFNAAGVITTMNAISSTSKHPEEAMKFLELINTDKEIYNLLCFGFEGTHYTLNEDGKAKYVENSGWQPQADWKFGNQFNGMLLEGMADDVWEQTNKMNEEAVKSKLLGFVFVKESVSTELSNIASVVGEYNKAAMTGYKAPEDYMDEYKSKLKAAGIDKVKAEMQKQIDEFLASKK